MQGGGGGCCTALWEQLLPLATSVRGCIDAGPRSQPPPLALPPQQSLNMLQGETKPIRRLVEARFDEIKAITEGGRPTLPADTSSW